MTVPFFIVKFIMWCLVAYGVTSIITESSLFAGFRLKVLKMPFFGKLFNCFFCLSFWMSIMVSWMVWSPCSTVFLNDVISMAKVQHHNFMLQHGNAFQVGYSQIMLIVLKWWYFLKIMFMDGLIGSAILWFMHIIEIKLSTNATGKEQGV